MNKEVSFKINQLLYDKGWRYELGVDETGHKVKNSLAEQRWNEGDLTYVDITIAEVVMWLYEKHGIWVEVYMDDDGTFGYLISKITKEGRVDSLLKRRFNSPTEAYEAAIEYTLNNLI